jgi:DnaK suppressor protein
MSLDDTQIQQLRQQLERQALELCNEIRAASDERSDADVGAGPDSGDDWADQGEREAREVVRDAEQARDSGELTQVQAALARIHDGRYGQCIDCGEDIDLRRLQVQPAAARCLPCQQHHEQGR